MIVPMLNCLKIIRDKIKLDTLNQGDITNKKEFNELKMLLENLVQYRYVINKKQISDNHIPPTPPSLIRSIVTPCYPQSIV